MYCKNCGKQIDYQAIICHECEAKEANQAAATVATEPTQIDAVKKKAFPNENGRGFASLVFAGAAFVLTLVTIFTAGILADPSAFPTPVLLFMNALAFTILSMIYSFKSLSIYKTCKSEQKPTLALKLGIVGLSLSIFMFNLLCYAFYCLVTV